MKKQFIKPILGLIFVLQLNLGFGQNDTMMIRVKFNNPNLLFDPTAYSAPALSTSSQLNDLLDNYNVSYFAPTFSDSVLNLDLKNYYSMVVSGNIDSFISQLERLQLSDTIEETPRIWPLCTSPVAINDQRIVSNWSNNYALQLADAQCAWSVVTGSNSDVRVAIIDTYFDTGHEDLSGQVRELYGPVTPTDHHGTEVLGVAGAKPNSIGIVGAGYNLKWDCSRVPYSSYGYYMVDVGIRNAVNKGARVLNISWSSANYPRTGIEDLIKRGIVVVVAAGNSPNDEFHGDIADIPGVIVVSGVDKDGNHGPTNHAHNSFVELCAVSVNVSTTGNGNQYTSGWGTSLSAPQVSATAGLILSLNPCFSPAQVEEIITGTTDPILDASSFPNKVGTGYLDMYEAVKLAAGTSGTLATNETWSTLHVVNDRIIVPNGKTLTITSKVLFYTNGGIYIQPGGKVIVDGGLLTSICESWEGIRVGGNSSLTQNGTNQGTLELRNDAIIEHARNAVSLGGLNSSGQLDYAKMGGIVISNNSKFRNNKRDVEFLTYHPKVSGLEANNISYFSNTQFVTDDNFHFANNNLPHITMWDVNGVRYLGCIFEDQRTGIVPKVAGRTAIYTINANYLISNYCTSYPCSGNPSKFLNLNSAITSIGNGTKGNISIEKCEVNSYKGILVQGINNATIRSNSFTIAHIIIGGGTDYPYGLYLDKCQTFNIEGNVFTGSTGTANTVNGGAAGLVIRNTGPNNNLFYRNSFNNLKIGTQVLGENREIAPLKGLRFKCNDYDGNFNDVDVRNDPNAVNPIKGQIGMAELQGQSQGVVLPANLFGNTSPILNLNIQNAGNFINYIYTSTATQGNRLFPYVISGKVSRVSVYNSPSCPDLTGSWGNDKYTTSGNIQAIRLVMIPKSNDRKALIDGGNTQNMIATINSANSGNIGTVLATLIANSPYLSNDVLALVAEQDAPFTLEMIRDILVLNPHSSRSYWVQSVLDDRIIPLPSAYRISIDSLIDVNTDRDTLEAEVSALIEDYDNNLSELLYSYFTDSLDMLDSISPWLKHPLNPTYHYQLAEIFFDRGEWAKYEEIVDSIPLKFTLDDKQESFYNSFTSLYTQLHDWQTEGYDINLPDSIMLAWLLDYRENCPDYFPTRLLSLLAINNMLVNQPDVYIPELEDSPAPLFTSQIQQVKSDYKPFFSIYPNPANKEIILKWNEGNLPSKLKVFGFDGKLISEYNWNENELILSVESFPNGIYFLEVQTTNLKITQKVLILR